MNENAAALANMRTTIENAEADGAISAHVPVEDLKSVVGMALEAVRYDPGLVKRNGSSTELGLTPPHSCE